MTHFEDLSFCDYFPFDHGGKLIAVGWVEKGHSFLNGTVSIEFFNKLSELLIDPFQPIATAGFHSCNICQFHGEIGKSNLFVPFDGKIFICPDLIIHYINAHSYLPPDIFIRAVMECPNTRTMDYKKKLLQCGGSFLIQI